MERTWMEDTNGRVPELVLLRCVANDQHVWRWKELQRGVKVPRDGVCHQWQGTQVRLVDQRLGELRHMIADT